MNKIVLAIKKLIKIFNFKQKGYLLILKNSKETLKITIMMFYDKIKHKNIIVFNASSLGLVQFLSPIYKELKKRSNNNSFYLACNYKMNEKSINMDISQSHYFNSSIAKFLFLTDIFIQPEIWGRGPKRAKRIFCGHGQSGSANWPDACLKEFDIFFLHGDLEKETFEKVKKDSPDSTKHIKSYEIGHPKLDKLIQGYYKREEVLKGIGLNPDFKTIIYAPHWHEHGALRTYGIKPLEEILKIEKLNLIVKLHPTSLEPENSCYYKFYTGGINWPEKFEIFNNYKNFKFINEYSIDPYLAASDVMITDYSTVALEFIALDRMVLYLDCPEVFKNKNIGGMKISRDDERFNAGRHTGIVVEKLKDLKSAIELGIQNPKEYSEKRQNLINKILYNPGKASSKAADVIFDLLNIRDSSKTT